MSESNGVFVSTLSQDFDLDLLVLVFNRNNIPYRLSEQGDGYDLWLDKPEHLEEAQKLLSQIQEVVLIKEAVDANQAEPPSRLRVLSLTPVTVAVILLGVIGALLTQYSPSLIHQFTFVDFAVSNDSLAFVSLEESVNAGEYWRFLTPVFLHFGLFHVVFNSLWLWEFGRRVEVLTGRTSYLVLMLALATGSNMGQYLWGGPAIFGGLSGLVYGLVGYVWIRHRISPHALLKVPPGIILMMLVWLFVCLVGIVDVFVSGGIANGAHVTGLLIGMAAGAIAAKRPVSKV